MASLNLAALCHAGAIDGQAVVPNDCSAKPPTLSLQSRSARARSSETMPSWPMSCMTAWARAFCPAAMTVGAERGQGGGEDQAKHEPGRDIREAGHFRSPSEKRLKRFRIEP